MAIDFKDVALVGSGLVTAISTLVAVLITNRFNLKLARLNMESQDRQRIEERRISLVEEIYLLFEKWELNFSQIYLHHLSCYRGKLTFRQVLDLVKEQKDFEPGSFQKLSMLMNVHFPRLAADYEEVDQARAEIVKYMGDPERIQPDIKKFVDAQENFEAVCGQFKRKISALVRSS